MKKIMALLMLLALWPAAAMAAGPVLLVDLPQDAQMIEHTCLQEGLYRITYSNSIAIYVNYNAQAIQVDNVTVEAQSYTVKGGAHGG